jgi:hypothetical protein
MVLEAGEFQHPLRYPLLIGLDMNRTSKQCREIVFS